MLDFSLNAHPRGYQLTLGEMSRLPILNPFAQRHYELSKKSNRWGHLFVALLESIPVAGMLVSLIERITVICLKSLRSHLILQNKVETSAITGRFDSLSISNNFSIKPNSSSLFDQFDSNSTSPRESFSQEGSFSVVGSEGEVQISQNDSNLSFSGITSSTSSPTSLIIVDGSESPLSNEVQSLPLPPLSPFPSLAEKEMIKVLQEAIFTHKIVDNEELAAKAAEQLTTPLKNISVDEVKFQVQMASEQGGRPSMEDAHFYQELPVGKLFGICDGHGEKGQIAQFVVKRIGELFAQIEDFSSDNMINAYSAIMKQIHQEVLDQKLDMIDGKAAGGTTAVVCFICQKTLKAYIATLGDSEIWHYRKQNRLIKATPLSCVRGWGSPSEAERVKKYMTQHAGKVKLTEGKLNLKGIGTLEPSRSIGDRNFNDDPTCPLVIQEPLVSMIQLLPGDRLIMACDGVWNFIEEMDELMKEVIQQTWNNSEMNTAQKIADYALSQHDEVDCDNVSVISLALD
jgi:serine/threonine protein phosphatase PrpC